MWKVMKKLINDTDNEDEVKPECSSGAKIKVIQEEKSTVKNTPVPEALPARTRTPMGSYIVPEGGKHLTSLAISYPGPSDYLPKIGITKQAAPQYSLVGRPKRQPATRDIPGPFNYNCSGDLIWKKKKVTLKGREKSQFDREANKSASVLGKYKVEYRSVGKDGPKFKMGTRADSKIVQGPVNRLVQPVDTKGFDTPGPNYRPNSSYWGRGPKKSFGGRFNLKTNVTKGPGPGDYEVPTIHRGPSHSFGIKLPEPVSVQQGVNKFSPAANTYDIGTTIGKAPAISIAGRCNTCPSESKVPCPTKYTPVYKCANDKYKAVTLTYRWFETDEDSTQPGPADYNVKHVNLKKNPSYTCRQRVKPSYPNAGTYDEAAGDMPGPGSYNPSREITESNKPAYSLGKRLETVSNKENIPGPNAYLPQKLDKPGSKKAPSFSMAKRLIAPNSRKDYPGPGEYSPNSKIYETEKGKYTIASRLRRKESYVNPVAPNMYTLPELLSGKKKGVVFKSRPSPYVYSGFRTNNIEEPRSLPPLVK
ncbi:uncharacterized protein LOC128547922 [Mercenaria mercenaria]|uniref:uncharacterized protein LOC128547922 n=1 Tax=Mercenaria mercenaria TaxID=6596 RepID=UPI00234E8DDB|nr:uncharacterized protein LOC128547922 [Mercenaria mercenaria]